MRVRALFAAAAFGASALIAVTAPSASAVCDPAFRPLCVNSCYLAPPPTDPAKLDDWLFRYCPQ